MREGPMHMRILKSIQEDREELDGKLKVSIV